MRLRYRKAKAIDGDTLRIKWKGLAWYVRIIGLDTDEISGPHKKRALEQKEELERHLRRWPKAKIVASVHKTRTEKWKYLKHHNGRFLCHVYIWKWFRYVNYADYMKSKGMVKRNSKWNK